METRSSNRLRPVQHTITAQQNGRSSIVVPVHNNKLVPRRRCRSETLPIVHDQHHHHHHASSGGHIQLQGLPVEAKHFDDLPDALRKQQQHHQQQQKYNLMLLQQMYGSDAVVLRNQDSAKNIFSCQQTQQQQLHQNNHRQHQQQQLDHSGRTSRSSRHAAAVKKENVVGEAAARNARMHEFEQMREQQQQQQQQRQHYTLAFDHSDASPQTPARPPTYEIVTRSSARRPDLQLSPYGSSGGGGGSLRESAVHADTAKRRVRSRSQSEPHDHRRSVVQRRSPAQQEVVAKRMDPSAITFKRPRDDRTSFSNSPQHTNGRCYVSASPQQPPHAGARNSLAGGLNGTAATANVLAAIIDSTGPTADADGQQQQPRSKQPTIAVNPKYTKIVNHHLVRSATPRFTVKPLNSLRLLRTRQAVAKAKFTSAAAAAAAAANGQRTTGKTMVVTVAQRLPTPQAIAGAAGATTVPQMIETRVGGDGAAARNGVEANGDDSDTNCSSLEDDDDFDDMGGEGDFNDSLSDLEDNGSHLSGLTASLDGKHSDASITTTDCVVGRYATSAPLSASLFPHCSPYISFATHSEKGPPLPAAMQKVLKWKLTTITPIVIRKVLLNTGFRLLRNVPTPEPTPEREQSCDDDEEEVDETNDWMGVWGKHMKSPCFKTLRSYQKINHIPGTFQIGRKDRVWRNLQTLMLRHGKKEFGFMPRTYVIPNDLKQLRSVWPRYSQHNVKWIIKPPASARGTGIKVVNRWSQIPKRKPLIVQRYIERPLLINGSKFDLRLYVLVTSINPLRVYMHTDGLARFASVKYSEKSDTLHDRYMHLTNYSINKLSANYAQNEDANACKGHKWTVKSLWTHLASQGVDTVGLWGAMRNLVLRTILAGENSINAMTKGNMCSRYNCFELFGIDVLLDSELKPWLLEVNISPSLHSASPLDLHVKGPLCTALLNTAMFQVPPRLTVAQQHEILAEQGMATGNLVYDKRLFVTNTTRAERTKHADFTNSSIRTREHYQHSILKHLTPDDVRTLMIAEDELARCAPLERIFPSPTSHQYLKFLEHPRYHNRLLDAWELRYGGSQKQRDEGIALLRKHAADRVHLIVPPQPVKKDSESNGAADDEKRTTADETADDDTTTATPSTAARSKSSSVYFAANIQTTIASAAPTKTASATAAAPSSAGDTAEVSKLLQRADIGADDDRHHHHHHQHIHRAQPKIKTTTEDAATSPQCTPRSLYTRRSADLAEQAATAGASVNGGNAAACRKTTAHLN